MDTFEDFLYILEANADDDKDEDELPDDVGDEDESENKDEDEEDDTGLPNDVGYESDKKEDTSKDRMKVDTNINAKNKDELGDTVEPELEDTVDDNTSDVDIEPKIDDTEGVEPEGDLDVEPKIDDTEDVEPEGDLDMGSEDSDIDGDSENSLDDDNEPMDDDEKAQKIKNNSVIVDIKSLYENLKLIEDTIATIVARDIYEQGIIDMTSRELSTIKNKTYDYILNIAYGKKYEENLAFLNNLRLIIELIGKNLKIIIRYRDDAEKK